MFLPHPRVKVNIVGSLRVREVACSASDRQGSNFESCVWRTVSSQSSHHPQEVLLAQFSLYVHKGGLKPDSFHFISFPVSIKAPVSFCFTEPKYLHCSGRPVYVDHVAHACGPIMFIQRPTYLDTYVWIMAGGVLVLTLSSLNLPLSTCQQAANCCRNSRLAVDEDDLKWVKK